jgi:hypothetical protein
MRDSFAAAPAPVDNSAGVIAMSRLADRSAAVAPSAAAASLASLLALGAGQISIDRVIRFVTRRAS